MANKSKQNLSLEEQDNEYLKTRQSRVQQNKKRMQDLGLKNIANSFTSLVESQKRKNKKVKSTYSNMRDVDYLPDNGDGSEEEYQRVKVSKKQHCPRYVPPMAMHKIAKLTKQHRVVAPKLADSNTIIKNHSKGTFSMGEFLSSNKGRRRMEVFKQNLEEPTCVKHGLKKRLALVDEDDDEDDDIFHDMEPSCLENDGYILRSQGYIDQDDEYDDMDPIESASNDDAIQGDDNHEDLEDEDDALLEDQLHYPELEKAIGTV